MVGAQLVNTESNGGEVSRQDGSWEAIRVIKGFDNCQTSESLWLQGDRESMWKETPRTVPGSAFPTHSTEGKQEPPLRLHLNPGFLILLMGAVLCNLQTSLDAGSC